MMDSDKCFERDLENIIALQQVCSERTSSVFDVFGKRDFLLPSEQRNFTHLSQVHSHRIIGPCFRFIDSRSNLFGLVGGRSFRIRRAGSNTIG